jgi:hypothetical protein
MNDNSYKKYTEKWQRVLYFIKRIRFKFKEIKMEAPKDGMEGFLEMDWSSEEDLQEV